ncbi:MAG TPA: DUF2892 domain-containing protein [Elusimicrobiota bacterium]|nr:DUF2892 domain-containing protein [Elusimicrobiota bacterium]
MSVEHRIRLIAGTFILLSLGGAFWLDANFIWFAAFVAVNLIQSAFSKWCLMEDLLRAWDRRRTGKTDF